MASTFSNNVPYPFSFTSEQQIGAQRHQNGINYTTVTFPNMRGRLPSIQASRLRTMMLEAYEDTSKILAFPCSYDALSSRLVEEAGFPLLFLSGYTVASTHGLPDTGYIAMQEMCDKIQETVRQASIPIMVDGDTGYGGPANVKRTVESFAFAGAAGIMIEDQTWPKRIAIQPNLPTKRTFSNVYLQVVATQRASLSFLAKRPLHACRQHATPETTVSTFLS